MSKTLVGGKISTSTLPRIVLSDHFRTEKSEEHILFSGRGTNLKTGKEISFKVPDTITQKGLESIAKNIRLSPYHNYLVMELQELFE